MTYIEEINAFYDWLETNPCSNSEISLWHALMHIKFRSGWKGEFAVAMSLIESKTGLERKAIERARNLLVQKGRIEYKKRPGRQAPFYQVNNLAAHFGTSNVVQVGVQTGVQPDHINTNGFKDNNNNTTPCNPPNIFTKFEKEFGRLLSPMESDKIKDWLEIDEHTENIIEEALRRAVLLGKHNFKYIDTILLEWKKAGLKTLTEIQEKDPMGKKEKKNTPRAPDITPIINPKKERIRGLYNI